MRPTVRRWRSARRAGARAPPERRGRRRRPGCARAPVHVTPEQDRRSPVAHGVVDEVVEACPSRTGSARTRASAPPRPQWALEAGHAAPRAPCRTRRARDLGSESSASLNTERPCPGPPPVDVAGPRSRGWRRGARPFGTDSSSRSPRRIRLPVDHGGRSAQLVRGDREQVDRCSSNVRRSSSCCRWSVRSRVTFAKPTCRPSSSYTGLITRWPRTAAVLAHPPALLGWLPSRRAARGCARRPVADPLGIEGSNGRPTISCAA